MTDLELKSLELEIRHEFPEKYHEATYRFGPRILIIFGSWRQGKHPGVNFEIERNLNTINLTKRYGVECAGTFERQDLKNFMVKAKGILYL